MALTKEDIMSVKAKGFLRNRGTECFSGRVVARGTVFSAEDFRALSDIAERYGSGKLICTSRLSVEIPGIPFENIDAAIGYAKEHGLAFGGTGAKVRPVTACKGSTCVYGNFDTHALAAAIHDKFYIGMSAVKLPHKFKIGIGGCPNSCMKPSLNDFGIEGNKPPVYDSALCRGCARCAVEAACPSKAAHVRDGKLEIDKSLCLDCGVCTGKCPFGAVAPESGTVYKIYVGGTWGKSTRMGTPLSRTVREDEVLSILEKTILWYKKNAYEKERLGKAVDRLGREALERELFSDDILTRREAILASPIKKRDGEG